MQKILQIFYQVATDLLTYLVGGGAITHCASLSGKWDSIYYNDINLLLVNLLQDAVNGKYNYNIFTPNFVDRKTFFDNINSNGYIKYIWSFSNDGKTYLYSKEKEYIMCKIFNYIVFNEKDKDIYDLYSDIDSAVISDDIEQRRQQWCSKMRLLYGESSFYRFMPPLTSIKHLQSLEQIKNKNISFNCHNYKDYEYQKGDIVYCDIPYENTNGYGFEFDNNEFYQWAKNQEFEIYISSYYLDDRFTCLYEKPKNHIFSSGGASLKVTERLYVNKV